MARRSSDSLFVGVMLMGRRQADESVRAGDAVSTRSLARQYLLPASIALASVLAFLPAFANDFVDWDDNLWITENPRLANAAGLIEAWTGYDVAYYYTCPLTFTSFWLEHRLWGLDPRGYHATNILLHAVNAVLVWYLLRRLGAGIWVAGLCAALFAVHPMQVQSVAWVTQRKNLLSSLFLLGSLLLYLRYRRSTAWHLYVLSLIAFVAAVLSKAAAVVLPVIILLSDWAIDRTDRAAARRLALASLRRCAPYFVAAAAASALSFIMEAPSGGQPRALLERILTAGAVPWFYLYKLAWPINLMPLYPPWPVDAAELAWWIPLVGLISAAALLIHYRNHVDSLLAWGLGFFLIGLLPVMGLVQFSFFRYSFASDHYVYLTCIGPFVVFAIFLREACRRAGSKLRAGVTAAILSLACLAYLSAQTWHRCHLWRDSHTLLTETLKHNPDFWMAWTNLGNVFAGQSDLEQAVYCYQRALDINPNDGPTHYNLGKALAAKGDLTHAAERYRHALQLQPDYVDARVSLANCLLDQDELAAAIEQYRLAAIIDPQNAVLLSNFGHALTKAGQTDEALRVLQRAVQADPRLVQARYNYAVALTRDDHIDQAIDQYGECLALQPDHASAENNLGTLLILKGQYDRAAEHFRRALEINPGDAQACANLGMALMLLGQFHEARHWLQEAHAMAESDLSTAMTLAWLLATCPDDDVRDGTKALALAQSICQATPSTNPRALDVLACAYAELGRFAEAQQCARQAIELARQNGRRHWLPELEKRLETFRANQPCRDTLTRPPTRGP